LATLCGRLKIKNYATYGFTQRLTLIDVLEDLVNDRISTPYMVIYYLHVV
jgi:hypothetical protein